VHVLNVFFDYVIKFLVKNIVSTEMKNTNLDLNFLNHKLYV